MSQVTLIFGRKKKGKSTLALHLAKRLNLPVFIFDPNRQFNSGAIVTTAADFDSVVEGEIVARGDVLIYRPMLGLEENFEVFASALLTQRDIAILVDEAARLMSPSGINRYLDELLRASGDHQLSLDMFLMQHRPQDCHGIAFEMADTLIFFSTKHPLALKKIEQYCSVEAAQRVSLLREREYLCWSVEEDNFFIEKNSESWFEDLRPSAQPFEEATL